jgi:hypothetical protein
MIDVRRLSQSGVRLAILIFSHIVVCCVSLVYVSRFNWPGSSFDPKAFHMLYDPARLYGAIPLIAAFALISVLFMLARFTFGYFVGFYLYTMVLGYLWLNFFSDFDYDHWSAGLSASVSAVAFLLPALFIASPIKQVYVLSEDALERILRLVPLFTLAVIALAASYNFRLVSLENIYEYRNSLESPAPVNYLVGITSSALLPFAFACAAARKECWRMGTILILLLLFFPITLSKTSFFAPLWLAFLWLLSKFFEVRLCVILSLFLPLFVGVILAIFFSDPSTKYFAIVNFRMLAIPSNAMDVYNDFFSRHDPTYFCQISFLRLAMHCPYQELGIVMKQAYGLGNFNASLFATEGIASVGVLFAPLAVFLCGLVIAVANRVSAGLPPSFILVSAAILPLLLVNVPLSIVLLTHGAGLLFFLWYIMPRAMFKEQ